MLGSLATGLVWRWATSGLPGVGIVLLVASLGGLFALAAGVVLARGGK